MKRLLIIGYPPTLDDLVAAFKLRPDWKTRVLPIPQTARRLAWPFAVVGAIPRVDLWYQFGGYAMRGFSFALSRLCANLRVPTILHWTGTDVLVARRLFERHGWLPGLLSQAHHWAIAPWLVDELADLGLKSEFMPLPKTRLTEALDAEPPPLPRRFRVLSYMSDRNHQTYGSRHLVRLARDLPDITIAVAGAQGTFLENCPSNLHFLGWIDDMSSAYTQATVLVRMVGHDGYAATVQEALAHGRQAIWTYSMPGVHQVKGYDDLKRCVQTLLARHREGTLSLNLEGREFVQRNLHRRVLDPRIVEGVERILDIS